MFFIVGTECCGTKTLAETLSQRTNAVCEHEPAPALSQEAAQYRYGQIGAGLLGDMIAKTREPEANRGPCGESNHSLSMLIPVLSATFSEAKYIWLVRNALDVVSSLMGREWYTRDRTSHHGYPQCDRDTLDGIDARIEGNRCGDVSTDQWTRMSAFEKCCWYWSYVNRVIEEDLSDFLEPDTYRIMRLERIDADIHSIVRWLDLEAQLPIEVEFHNGGQHARYECGQWTAAEKRAFIRWCGPLMDRLYPGWRARFRELPSGAHGASHMGNARGDVTARPDFADPEQLVAQGEQVCEQGDLEGARAKFEAALAVEPGHVMANNDLGAVLWELGEGESALQHLTRALELDPDERTILLNLFPVLISLGQEDTLIQLYRAYTQRWPEDAEIAVRLQALEQVVAGDHRNEETPPADLQSLVAEGERCCAVDHLDAARVFFQQALELDENNVTAFSNLGTVFWKQGLIGEAVECFTRALALDPTHREAVINCATAAAELGFGDVAMEVYRSYLSHKPDDADIQARLSQVLAQDRETDSGDGADAASGPSADTDPESLMKDGESFYQEGDLEKARNAFEYVLKIQPGNVEALNNLGTVCWESGDVEGAVQHLADALEQRPDHPEAAMNCATILESAGHADEAGLLRHTAAGRRQH